MSVVSQRNCYYNRESWFNSRPFPTCGAVLLDVREIFKVTWSPDRTLRRAQLLDFMVWNRKETLPMAGCTGSESPCSVKSGLQVSWKRTSP